MTGLLCPHCGASESEVTDSRPVERAVRRRRGCRGCERRFTTFELVDQGNSVLDISQLGRRDRGILAAVVRQMLAGRN